MEENANKIGEWQCAKCREEIVQGFICKSLQDSDQNVRVYHLGCITGEVALQAQEIRRPLSFNDPAQQERIGR